MPCGSNREKRDDRLRKTIPDGYHSVTPYLFIDGAAEAIEFYKKALGVAEVMCMPGPGGQIGHAELQIADSRIMLADEHPEMGVKGPGAYGGLPVMFHLYLFPSRCVLVRLCGLAHRHRPTPCQSKKLLTSPLIRVLEDTLEIPGGGGVIVACELPW